MFFERSDSSEVNPSLSSEGSFRRFCYPKRIRYSWINGDCSLVLDSDFTYRHIDDRDTSSSTDIYIYNVAIVLYHCGLYVAAAYSSADERSQQERVSSCPLPISLPSPMDQRESTIHVLLFYDMYLLCTTNDGTRYLQ
jgi:hypothetical protein